MDIRIIEIQSCPWFVGVSRKASVLIYNSVIVREVANGPSKTLGLAVSVFIRRFFGVSIFCKAKGFKVLIRLFVCFF